MNKLNMSNLSVPEMVGVGCGGCLAIIILMALVNMTIGAALLWFAWNLCVVTLLAPAFGWTLPLLSYWQLVAASFALSIIGGFFGRSTVQSSSS